MRVLNGLNTFYILNMQTSEKDENHTSRKDSIAVDLKDVKEPACLWKTAAKPKTTCRTEEVISAVAQNAHMTFTACLHTSKYWTEPL